mgnify:FL=1
MMMKREEFLKHLSLTAPALAAEDERIVAVFSSFCFNGGALVTHNDIIAVNVPLKTSFCGVIPGHLLYRFIKSCSGTEVDLIWKEGDEELIVKCGSAKLRLPVIGVKEYPFEFPKLHGDLICEVNEYFFEGLDLCSKIVVDKGLTSWMGGVLFDFTEDLHLYSFGQSRDAICVYKLAGLGFKDKAKKKQVILPVAFCKIALEMYKRIGCEDAKLCVHNNYATLYFSDNSAVFGKTIVSERQPDTVGKVRGYLKEAAKEMIPIQNTFRNALKRAAAIATNEELCSITIVDGKLNMRTEVRGGNLKDFVALKKKHPDVDVLVNPKLLVRMMDCCTDMRITDSMVVFLGGKKFTYITANKQQQQQ